MYNKPTEQDDQILKEFDNKLNRIHKRGKFILIVIITVNIIISVVFCILKLYGLLSLILQICLTIGLYRGTVWVKYLYTIFLIINTLLSMYILSFVSGMQLAAVLISFIYIAFEGTSIILLLANKSISEFLYDQKNG